MTLTVIKKAARHRRFLTYDLEWRKGEMKIDERGRQYHNPIVRMAGLYDGARYRWFETIEEFLRFALTKRHRGAWFYADAGGLADMIFVLDVLSQWPEYRIEAAFSGSSAIIVNVKRGRHAWHFVDSYWLLKDKLANIAKFVGMEKGNVDFDEENMAELVEYNEDDCKILWKAIDRFESALLELGGQLQMTLASSAMQLFRRKYLQRDIMTGRALNELSRNAYYASRVEVFQKKCEEAWYYDINSSFPFSMTFPCPGQLKQSTRSFSETQLQGDDSPFLAHVEITVPPMELPPLPHRVKGSLYFPVGTWEGWYTNLDLALLLERGGKIDYCHEAVHFEAFDDLGGYARDLYARRLRAKREGQTMEVMVYKLLLNSLYGKFAEGRVKTGLVVHPENAPAPWDETSDMHYLMPGVYMQDREVDVPHAHVPISVHITSRSRRLLYEHMAEANEVYYCDTDGFACDNPNIETSPELGGLKLETEVHEGIYHRPKVYMQTDKDGIQKPRAKGFSLKPEKVEVDKLPEEEREAFVRSHSVERFMELLEGREIEMRRFVRIRELWKSGQTTPTERTIKKRFRDHVREKRCLLPDGIHTRPWDIKELEPNAD